MIAAWKRAVDTGEPYDIEQRMRRADGIYRWFHVRGLPLRDAQGRVARWYVLETDIDDRKRAEALLAGEKRLLEMVAGGRSMSEILEALCRLVEATASGCYCSVVLVDPSGTRLEHGAAPSLPASFINSIIGRPVNVRFGSLRDGDLPERTSHCRRPRVGDPMGSARVVPNGHGAWASGVLVNADLDQPTGKVLGAFAIYYDRAPNAHATTTSLIEQFTHVASIAIERAQSDAALKRSEARKAAILDSALDCIVTIDHEGCITEFNPAAERTFGYHRNDVLGRQLADIIIPPSLREKHRQGLARYLDTGEARMIGRRVEMTAVRADGSEFPCELAISRIPLDGPPSFTGYLRDITERKQSEEKLRRSEAFLAEAQHLSSNRQLFLECRDRRIHVVGAALSHLRFEQGVPVTLRADQVSSITRKTSH